jgi:hypothetical protein
MLSWFERLQNKLQDVFSSLDRTITAAKDQKTFLKAVRTFFTGLGYIIDHFFGGTPVLFFGPVGGGKTSLIRYLIEGQPPHGLEPTQPGPPQEVERRPEIGTQDHGADRTVLHLLNDVSGESRDFWRRILRVVDPKGIIILIDGANTYECFREEYRQTLEDIAPVYTQTGRNLLVVHTFLNKYDLWRHQNSRKLRLAAIVNEEIARLIDCYPALARVKWGSAETQLNPGAASWPEVDHALNHFRTDLKEGAR